MRAGHPLREITRGDGGEPTRITLKAEGVLLVLVANAGKVVSREALMAWVWPDTMPTDDVITQAVTQLRKALGNGQAGSGQAYIETIAKQGYRLLAPVIDPATGAPICVTTPGDASTMIGGCVPVNFLGGVGTLTPEMLDYITFQAHDQFEYTQKAYYANIGGDLFELPGGPLAFSFGVEHREESGFDHPDALINAGDTTGNARTATDGGYSLDEAYLEFAIPVLKDVPGRACSTSRWPRATRTMTTSATRSTASSGSAGSRSTTC